MALVIRFSRTGKRGERKFRIIVKEKRDKRDGKAIDLLGYYEKKDKETIIKKIDEKKLKYWTEHGAQVSNAVKEIL